MSCSMYEERLHFPVSSHPELDSMIKRNDLIFSPVDHQHRHLYFFNSTYIRERIPRESESPVEYDSEDRSKSGMKDNTSYILLFLC